jgi:hypothetical protein
MTYAKAVLSALVALAGALAVGLGTGNDSSLGALDLHTWLLGAAAVLGSGGIVYLCENGPWHPYIKTVVAFLSSGIASLITALNDNHITQAELLVAFSAAVTATGLVFQVSNTRLAARRTTGTA